MSEQSANKLMVTRPLTPPLSELLEHLNIIWDSGILTNRGQFVKMLEDEMCKYLGVSHLSLVSNGTLALILALKALNLKGEVITTPFTHIATALAIHWNNLKPVFVDIDESSLTMDTLKLKKSIGPDTCAILPVHIFGNPCDTDEIHKIGKRHNLPVIYDAAHSFGVKLKRRSVCHYGDLSILSFHATKVFNCIEGGAVVCSNERLKKSIDTLTNFGIDENLDYAGYGLNAKMNELQAAYGITALRYIDEAIRKRREAVRLYQKLFKNIKGISFISEQSDVEYNYCYFPIIINPAVFGINTEQTIQFLHDHKVFPKRYFYPLVTDYSLFKMFKIHDLPTAESVSKNTICLPLSDKIQTDEVSYVVNLFNQLYKRNKVRTTLNTVYKTFGG